MNALFALALLVSPAWAGVVAPVENGVAPAGPSAPAVPVAAPGGAGLGAPSLGSGADLRGAIPVLPAPVPGLLGAVKHFVGEAVEAAAPAARPDAGAVRTSPAQATALRGRAADRTPALPGKLSPGSPSLAISRDREDAGSALDDAASPSRGRGEDPSREPLADSASIQRARPEKAAGLGRRFFDQGDDRDRGALADPAASVGAGPAIAAALPEGSVFGLGRGAAGRGAAPDADAAVGAGHGTVSGAGAWTDPARGEALRDAVASVPGAGASPGAAVMFRSAAPNGELARGRAAEPSVAAPLPVLGAPRPLALDLSREGLIVRVRSALNGALSSAASETAAARPLPPGPSTAFLERGAMLEAFSVAGDYAARAGSDRAPRPLSSVVPRAARLAVPSPEPSAAPLWWAWLALPLLVAAVRGIL